MRACARPRECVCVCVCRAIAGPEGPRALARHPQTCRPLYCEAQEAPHRGLADERRRGDVDTECRHRGCVAWAFVMHAGSEKNHKCVPSLPMWCFDRPCAFERPCTRLRRCAARSPSPAWCPRRACTTAPATPIPGPCKLSRPWRAPRNGSKTRSGTCINGQGNASGSSLSH